MNRNGHTGAIGRLPILSAALLSAAGLLCDGARSGAAAQSTSGEVIVNYDVLNGLPGGSGAYGATPAPQIAPGYAPAPYGATVLMPYAPYLVVRPGMSYVPLVPGTTLATPPSGAPTSALTILGANGRPTVPIQLKRPGSDSQVATLTPPDEPSDIPDIVPMPESTPDAPAPGVNSGQPPAAPTIETPAAPAEAAAQPAEEAAEQPGDEPPAEQQPAEEQAAQEPAPEQQAAQEQSAEPADQETPPEEGQAAQTTEEQPAAAEQAAAEEQPAAEEQAGEEAAAEPAPGPDNTQPAAPIPQGGIRIVFPSEFNEVPGEANAALDDLAAQMAVDESMRIEIKCYASGTEDTESKARRKSLQRCINIRQYLFKKDVRTTRMDVRALGLKSEGQPADRVDIVPANS
jgi:hypothetical protein